MISLLLNLGNPCLLLCLHSVPCLLTLFNFLGVIFPHVFGLFLPKSFIFAGPAGCSFWRFPECVAVFMGSLSLEAALHTVTSLSNSHSGFWHWILGFGAPSMDSQPLSFFLTWLVESFMACEFSCTWITLMSLISLALIAVGNVDQSRFPMSENGWEFNIFHQHSNVYKTIATFNPIFKCPLVLKT